MQPQVLTTSSVVGAPSDWSPDGAVIAVEGSQQAPKIWLVHVKDGTARQWLETPFAEFGGAFSPDGGWVAYASNQSGVLDVWVRPFPGPGAPVRVSPEGGRNPVWSRDGREIFYESGPRLMSARIISQAPDFRAEAPRILFEGGFMRDDTDPNIRYLTVGPDGRFLAVASSNAGANATMVVVKPWEQKFERLLANR